MEQCTVFPIGAVVGIGWGGVGVVISFSLLLGGLHLDYVDRYVASDYASIVYGVVDLNSQSLTADGYRIPVLIAFAGASEFDLFWTSPVLEVRRGVPMCAR